VKEVSFQRSWLKTAGGATSALVLSAASAHAAAQINPDAIAERPNFLILFTDDQGFGDLSLHGNEYLETPNMDALGRESVQFSNFFVQACCSPSRACLLTGRSPHEVGVWGVHMGRSYINLEETLFPEMLKDAGYTTFMAGKWHNGKDGSWYPWNRGFDEVFMGDYHQKSSRITHNGEKAKTFDGWERDTLIQHCVDFMTENQDRPFCAYMPFFTPHTPWVAPERLIEKHKARGQSDKMSLFNAYMEHLDEGIGTLLGELDRLGLAENTVVIFMSDNGPTPGGMNAEDFKKRNPQGYRGAKGDIWDLGLRSPFFVRWPGKFKPQTVTWNTGIEDIYPTLAELAGAEIPKGKKLAGKSIVPLLQEGQAATWTDRFIRREHFDPYWSGKTEQHDLLSDRSLIRYEDQSLTIRNQRFKLCQVGPTFDHADHEFAHTEGYVRGALYQLYDIQTDPAETNDVSAEHPELFAEMKAALEAWYRPIMEAPNAFPKPSIELGFPGEEKNRIRLSLAYKMAGSVKRSRFQSMPQWIQAGDQITLHATVMKTGRYQVTLHGKHFVDGSKVEIRVGDSVLQKEISGAEKLSFVPLGTLNLKDKGATDLTFTLLEIPGDKPLASPFWRIDLEAID